jgi:hypothetical protein
MRQRVLYLTAIALVLILTVLGAGLLIVAIASNYSDLVILAGLSPLTTSGILLTGIGSVAVGIKIAHNVHFSRATLREAKAAFNDLNAQLESMDSQYAELDDFERDVRSVEDSLSNAYLWPSATVPILDRIDSISTHLERYAIEKSAELEAKIICSIEEISRDIPASHFIELLDSVNIRGRHKPVAVLVRLSRYNQAMSHVLTGFQTVRSAKHLKIPLGPPLKKLLQSIEDLVKARYSEAAERAEEARRLVIKGVHALVVTNDGYLGTAKFHINACNALGKPLAERAAAVADVERRIQEGNFRDCDGNCRVITADAERDARSAYIATLRYMSTESKRLAPLGVDMSEVEYQMLLGIGLLKEGQVKGAASFVLDSWKGLQAAAWGRVEAEMSMLSELNECIALAGETVGHQAESIAEAKRLALSGKFADSIDRIAALRVAGSEQLSRAGRGAAVVMAEIDALLRTTIKDRTSIDEAMSLFAESRKNFDEGRYSAAAEIARKAKDSAVATVGLHCEVMERLESVRKIIADARAVGINIDIYLGEIENIEGMTDYANALETLGALESKIVDEETELSRKAIILLDDTKRQIWKLDAKGIDTQSLHAQMREANEFKAAGAYGKVLELGLKASAEAKAAMETLDACESIYAQARKTIQDLQDGTGIDAGHLLEDLVAHPVLHNIERANLAVAQALDAMNSLVDEKRTREECESIYEQAGAKIKEVQEETGINAEPLLESLSKSPVLDSVEKANLAVAQVLDKMSTLVEERRIDMACESIYENARERILEVQRETGIAAEPLLESLAKNQVRHSIENANLAVAQVLDKMSTLVEEKRILTECEAIYSQARNNVLELEARAGIDSEPLLESLLKSPVLNSVENANLAVSIVLDRANSLAEERRLKVERDLEAVESLQGEVVKCGFSRIEEEAKMGAVEELLAAGSYVEAQLALDPIAAASRKSLERAQSLLGERAETEKFLRLAEEAGLKTAQYDERVRSLAECKSMDEYEERLREVRKGALAELDQFKVTAGDYCVKTAEKIKKLQDESQPVGYYQALLQTVEMQLQEGAYAEAILRCGRIDRALDDLVSAAKDAASDAEPIRDALAMLSSHGWDTKELEMQLKLMLSGSDPWEISALRSHLEKELEALAVGEFARLERDVYAHANAGLPVVLEIADVVELKDKLGVGGLDYEKFAVDLENLRGRLSKHSENAKRLAEISGVIGAAGVAGLDTSRWTQTASELKDYVDCDACEGDILALRRDIETEVEALRGRALHRSDETESRMAKLREKGVSTEYLKGMLAKATVDLLDAGRLTEFIAKCDDMGRRAEELESALGEFRDHLDLTQSGIDSLAALRVNVDGLLAELRIAMAGSDPVEANHMLDVLDGSILQVADGLVSRKMAQVHSDDKLAIDTGPVAAMLSDFHSRLGAGTASVNDLPNLMKTVDDELARLAKRHMETATAKVKDSIDRVESMGITVVSFRESFKSVTEGTDAHEVISLLAEVERDLLAYKESYARSVRELMAKTENWLNTLTKDGVNVSEPVTLMREGVELFKGEKLDVAQAKFIQARDLGHQQLELKERIAKGIAELEALKPRALGVGIDISPEIGDISAAAYVSDYTQSLERIITFTEELTRNMEQFETETKDELKAAGVALATISGGGERKPIWVVYRLGVAERLAGEGKFGNCRAVVSSLPADIAASRESYAIYSKSIAEVGRTQAEMAERGFDLGDSKESFAALADGTDYLEMLALSSALLDDLVHARDSQLADVKYRVDQAESELITMEASGIRCGELPAILSRVKEAYANGHVKEAYAQAGAFHQAAGAVKTKHVGFVAQMGELDRRLTALRNLEIPTDSVEADVQRIIAGTSYDSISAELDAVGRRVDSIQDETRQSVEGILGELLDAFERSAKEGIHSPGAESAMRKAMSMHEAGRYRTAEALAGEANEMLRASAEKHEAAMSLVSGCCDRLDEFGRTGIVMEPFRAELELIADGADYDELGHMVAYLLSDVEDQISRLKEDYRSRLISLRSEAEMLAPLNVDDLEQIKIRLDSAEESVGAGAFQRGERALAEAKAHMVAVKEAGRRVDILLEDAKDVLRRFERYGIDGTAFSNDLGSIRSITNIARREALVQNIISEMDQTISKVADTAKRALDDTQKLANACLKERLAIPKALSLLKEGEAFLKNSLYVNALDVLNECQEDIARTREMHVEYVAKSKEVNSTLKELHKKGIPTDEFVARIVDIDKMGDYGAMMSMLDDVKRDLDAYSADFVSALKNSLDELSAEAHQAEKRGVDLAPVSKKILEASLYLTDGNHSRAITARKEAEELLAQLKAEHEEVQNRMEDLRKLVDTMRRGGLDVSDMARLVEKVEKEPSFAGKMGAIAKALAFGEKALYEVTVMAKEQLHALEATLSRMQADGIVASSLVSSHEEAMVAFNDERFADAVDICVKTANAASEIRNAFESAKKLIVDIEKTLAKVEAKGTDVSDLSHRLRELMGSGDYRGAIVRMKSIETEALERELRFIDEAKEMIRGIKSYVEDLKKGKIHVGDAFSILSRAEATVASGDYGAALVMAIEAKEIASFQHQAYLSLNRQVSKFRPVIDEAKKMGIPMERESKVLDDVLDGVRDYSAAMKKMLSISAGLEKVKVSMQEKAMRECTNAKASLREMDGLPSADFLWKKLEIAEQALLKDEFYTCYAESSYINTQSKSISEMNKAYKGFEKSVRESMGVLNGMGVDTTEYDRALLENSTKDLSVALPELKRIKEEILAKTAELADAELRKVSEFNDRIDKLGAQGSDVSLVKSLIEKMVQAGHDKPLEVIGISSEVEKLLDVSMAGLKIERELIRLPYSHGMETELQVVTSEGKWIPGAKMSKIFVELLQESEAEMRRAIEAPDTPTYIKDRAGCVKIEADDHGNDQVKVEYTVKGKTKFWGIIGKDSHVSFDTNILEIATPPCEYLKELEWWIFTIFKVSYNAVKSRGIGLNLVPTGLNQYEPFATGVSFGDHHHIDIPDAELNIAVYNMLRDYIPHMIALSVNSPFKHKEIPDIKQNPMNSFVLPQGNLSSRLEQNTGQLSLVPEMKTGEGKLDFMNKLQKADEKSARMVDVYPFTRFKTIEIRFMDSQLSISNRIAMAVLAQAIALKATNMMKAKRIPVNVSESNLKMNRERAVRTGLLASFSIEPNMINKDPVNPYGQFLQKEAKKGILMSDACKNLLYFLKDELAEMNVLGTTYLDPILIELYGGKTQDKSIGLPMCPAQFQLHLYKQCNGKATEVVRQFDTISQLSAAAPSYNPIIDLLGTPAIPEFLVQKEIDLDIIIKMETAYVGDAINVDICVTNPDTQASKHDLAVEYKVRTAEGESVKQEKLVISTLRPKKKHTIPLKFVMDKETSNLVVDASVALPSATVSLTKMIPIHRFVVKAFWLGRSSYIPTRDTVDVPFSVEIDNGVPKPVKSTMTISALEEGSKKVIGSKDYPIEVSKKTRVLYVGKTLQIAQWASEALENQSYVELQPLEVPTPKQKNLNCFIEAKIEFEGRTFKAESSQKFRIFKGLGGDAGAG